MKHEKGSQTVMCRGWPTVRVVLCLLSIGGPRGNFLAFLVESYWARPNWSLSPTV